MFWDVAQIPRVHLVAIGADSRIRTDDLIITNDLLYQLSYIGICTTILLATSFSRVAAADESAVLPPTALAPRKAG
jgi:hypothetical protein